MYRDLVRKLHEEQGAQREKEKPDIRSGFFTQGTEN